MKYNANGWPQLGRYIGEVDDIYYQHVLRKGRVFEPNEWAKRRVYNDELYHFNNLPILYGKSIVEIIQDLKYSLDKLGNSTVDNIILRGNINEQIPRS